MVNHSLMVFLGPKENTTVLFHNAPHQQLFNVLLKDFLERVAPFLGENIGSQVELLNQVCDNPEFNSTGSVGSLKDAARALREWLRTEVSIKHRMPSLDREAVLRFTREEFIGICGTIAKHSLARLTLIAEKVSSILARSKVGVSQYDALLVLDDFYDRFHSDVLNYHTTTLAELLNNVRWGIQDYLSPEFRESLSQSPGQLEYSYRYPTGIDTAFGKTFYWDLMNDVRRGPYVEKFVGDPVLKLRY
jgi:hypothetical protein